MTREKAIRVLTTSYYLWLRPSEEEAKALRMAIDALKRERTDEWCTGCKEYDTEKKCCPRFNRVIREALKREPSEDGTLEVKVEDATKIGRVLISDDKHRGGLYYPDEDEPQSVSFENDTEIKSCSKDSDLISKTEAIKAIEIVDWYHQNQNKDMVHGANDDEHQAWYKADDVYKALDALPSADRPKWTPCAERMPDDGKWAIWCSNEGVIGIARYKEDGYFKHFYPNDASFELEDAVAWMPLPEPYKKR